LFLSLFNSHIDLHLKVLINFFFFFFIIISISISISISSIISIIIITIIIIVIVLLLFIIYTINLPVVRSRSCRVIYYFDTPTLGKRHQSFGRVRRPTPRHQDYNKTSSLGDEHKKYEITTNICQFFEECSSIKNQIRKPLLMESIILNEIMSFLFSHFAGRF
jgi:hypothetical protein